MNTCPACRSAVPDDAKVCPSCGAARASTPSSAEATRALHATSASAPPPRSVHGRFEPGHRLGERYRIVGLLGRGGMGEVYRADDLELGQSVALKFLPERLANDPIELDRFRREVRVARDVAHPNVCRTYDIATEGAHVFLVMEYVDGEDLASVIRRLGRPSTDKAVEIARQLCLGLGAAHEAGILHRDLKPANIMIDGRGRVRITDFGLAGLAEELAEDRSIAGTPAYMAPEQLRDGVVSTASEVYSLGLILYEVFTGKRVFDTHNVQELKRLHSESRISSPSSIVTDLDPTVERVLLRCLDPDPSRRPQSSYAVLAALPGGDPLAAALAAGETPSPELVADAGEQGVVTPRVAVPVIVVTIALFLGYAYFAGNAVRGLERSPAELSVLADQTYSAVVGDELPRFEGGGFFRPVPDSLNFDPTYRDAIYFWKTWSPRGLTSDAFHSEFLDADRLQKLEAGDAGVVLDRHGDLRAFRRVLAGADFEPGTPDPGPIFEVMDLDPADYEGGADPDRPGEFTWTRRQGEGPTSLHALYRGASLLQLTSTFPPVDMAPLFLSTSPFDPMPFLATLLFLGGPVLLGAFLAWRNLRAGRGDRRGATVFAAVVFVGYIIQSVLATSIDSMPTSLVVSRLIAETPVGHALYHAVMVWIQYLAIEPYMRRVRPTALVSWARMVARRWSDPILGRDVLAGLFLGAVVAAVEAIAGRVLFATDGTSSPVEVLGSSQLLGLGGTAEGLAWWAYAIAFSAPAVMQMLVLYLLFVLVFRRDAVAIVVIILLVVVMGGVMASPLPFWFGAVLGLTMGGSMVVAVMRFGVLAGVTLMLTLLLRGSSVWALEPAAWYGPLALMTPLLVAALTIWAGKTALGERASLKTLLGEEPTA